MPSRAQWALLGNPQRKSGNRGDHITHIYKLSTVGHEVIDKVATFPLETISGKLIAEDVRIDRVKSLPEINETRQRMFTVQPAESQFFYKFDYYVLG